MYHAADNIAERLEVIAMAFYQIACKHLTNLLNNSCIKPIESGFSMEMVFLFFSHISSDYEL